MKAHLAANMCRIEQTVPSRTVDAEPDNTLNTLSPGRSSRWILPHELETPDRPTSSGLQSPVGVPVQFGPSPMTREYSATPPAHVPPAQWGEVYGRGSDDGCELFGTAPEAEESDELCPQVAVPQLDELQHAHSPIAPLPQVPVIAARCVNGNLLRPSNAEDEQPSTALQQSEVRAPGGVQLGRGTPGQSPGPGGRRGRDVHPPLPLGCCAGVACFRSQASNRGIGTKWITSGFDMVWGRVFDQNAAALVSKWSGGPCRGMASPILVLALLPRSFPHTFGMHTAVFARGFPHCWVPFLFSNALVVRRACEPALKEVQHPLQGRFFFIPWLATKKKV